MPRPSDPKYSAHAPKFRERALHLLRDLERIELEQHLLLEGCRPSPAHGLLEILPRLREALTDVIVTQELSSATPSLELRCFGKFEVRVNSRPVKFAFARCAELVAWLALHGPTSRAKIVDALWDGSNTPSHLEYFRVVVRRARAALTVTGQLEFNPIIYSAHIYRLAPQLIVASDVALVEQVSHHASTEVLQSALEVYEGEFLPNVSSEWAALRRTKLLDAILEIALRLGETLETVDPRASIAAYRRAIALEPLFTPALEGLLGLHERLGERSAARSARVALQKIGG